MGRVINLPSETKLRFASAIGLLLALLAASINECLVLQQGVKYFALLWIEVPTYVLAFALGWAPHRCLTKTIPVVIATSLCVGILVECLAGSLVPVVRLGLFDGTSDFGPKWLLFGWQCLGTVVVPFCWLLLGSAVFAICRFASPTAREMGNNCS